MKPAPVDLPIIWRGCTWEAIILRWKNQNGTAINLQHWVPFACTAQFSLNALVTAPAAGEAQMSLTRQETTGLPLGVFQWNWLWANTDGTVPPPFLAGIVEVKNPIVPTIIQGGDPIPVPPPEETPPPE